jgi:hypothetical protein
MLVRLRLPWQAPATLLDLLRQAAQPRLHGITGPAEPQRPSAELGPWHDLIERIVALPDSVVVTCAYCVRVQTPDGAWHVPPRELRAYLVERQLLSHTFCADCLLERGLD